MSGNYRLAVRNRQGDTTFSPIRMFGKLAEGATAIKKGTKLLVDGELEISAFDGDDGGKRMTFTVIAASYRFPDSGHHPGAAEELAQP